jgi:hypothetical protein
MKIVRLVIALAIVGSAVLLKGDPPRKSSMKLREVLTTGKWENDKQELFRGTTPFNHNVQGPWTLKVEPIDMKKAIEAAAKGDYAG